MSGFLNDFLSVIRNCKVVNTYKMAWAKAIVEVCNDLNGKELEPIHVISLEELAEKVVKYYWNQVFFFGLEENFLFHHNTPNKTPDIVKVVKEEIARYMLLYGRKPEFFEKVSPNFKEQMNLAKVVSTLKKDVSWRFLELNGETTSIYEYQKNNDALRLSREHIQQVCDNTYVLLEAINYRWSMVLESFNPGTPNICKKVRIQSDQKIRRINLKKYRPTLLLENPERICSLCGQPITDEKELSIDHVVPWSYLYSNDLWNFLFAHKGCNSGKLNSIPDEAMIQKLEAKNARLLAILKARAKDAGNKDLTELEFAIEHGYVRRFWNMCRGF